MDTKDRNLVSSALRGGKPYKSYIKTILGKVYVSVWNSFESVPEGIILEGDPRKAEDESIVDVWSQEEDYFFTTKNKRQLQTGNVIPYVRREEVRERTVAEYSDEELSKFLEEKFKKFFALQNLLNEIDSIAVLFRIKNIAEDQERSDKVIKAIEARISELQSAEYKAIPTTVESEL